MNSLSSTLSRRALLNVPSPNPDRASYARFIPREELGEFASWTPGSFGGFEPPSRKAAAPEPEEPAGPTPEEWAAQVDAARQQGYEQGYRDGMAALEAFKKSHAEQVNAQLGQFVQALDAEFDGLHGELAEAVTRIAVQMARQVLRSELQLAPSHVAKVAAEAVEAVLLSARARGARLVAHPGIERGGCRVESDAGAIDARVATRWAQAAAALGSDEPWQDAEA